MWSPLISRVVVLSLLLAAFNQRADAVQAVVIEDTSTSSVMPTKVPGAGGSLKISRTHAGYVQFDLSSLPEGTTGDQIQRPLEMRLVLA
jgi:hypothetical protein